MGQIDHGALMARDDLAAQNAVMVFRSHKIGAVEGEADAEPDGCVKKIGIGMKGFAEAVHAADKLMSCTAEYI